MTEPKTFDERAAGLSPREWSVLELAARGVTNAAAAAELDISIHAIKFHLASIYRKLGVANRTQAAAAYVTYRNRGLVD